MLVLSRKPSERICIGNDIEIMICQVGKNQVRLGITAPTTMVVVRKELLGTERNVTAAARRSRRLS